VSVVSPAAPSQAAKPWLERFLGLFADVKAGEGPRALLLTANIFLVLVAYYMLKVIREPLILTGGAFGLKGATLKAAASCAIALVLIAVVPAYSALASRVDRMRLINVVSMIFVGCLVAFFVLARGLAVGLPFFIWVGIFNLMVIAQFWSFANDLYTPEQGKRLFAIVAFGQTIGAIIGADLARRSLSWLGIYPLMLVAAGLLFVAVIVANLIARSGTASERAGERAHEHDPAGETKAGGFKLVVRSRYLLAIGGMLLLLNTVNSNGEYILGHVVVDAAHEAAAAHGAEPAGTSAAAAGPAAHRTDDEEKRFIGEFYGDYFTWVNIISALLQLLVVSRVLKYAGVGWALMVMPTISLVGYGAIAFLPVLAVIRATKVAENSLDYSLENTTRQALFLPTSRDEKYKGKEAVDTVFVRLGDVAALAVIALVAEVLGRGAAGVAAVNVALVVVWLALAWFIGRRHQRMVATPPTRE